MSQVVIKPGGTGLLRAYADKAWAQRSAGICCPNRRRFHELSLYASARAGNGHSRTDISAGGWGRAVPPGATATYDPSGPVILNAS